MLDGNSARIVRFFVTPLDIPTKLELLHEPDEAIEQNPVSVVEYSKNCNVGALPLLSDVNINGAATNSGISKTYFQQ